MRRHVMIKPSSFAMDASPRSAPAGSVAIPGGARVVDLTETR